MDRGISLFHIWEHDWAEKPDILKSMVLSRLGQSGKIHARKTKVVEVDAASSKRFFEQSHLQGSVHAELNLGLVYGEDLVGIMSFGKSRFNKKYQWELLRFASKLNYTIVGGASKLLSFFTRTRKPTSLISYADMMYSNGNLYKNIGFSEVARTKPGYHYTSDYVTVFSRHKFQKHKLKKILPIFDETLSEQENMNVNGFDRIWDCGQLVFELALRND
jgi:hypothetical protein